MANARVARGRKTQRLIAQWLNEHGWPDAKAVHADEHGRDVQNVPGHAVEVKGRYGFDFQAWMRQARKNAGADAPAVILRMNGQGPAHIGDFLVVRRLADDELAYGQRASEHLRFWGPVTGDV